MRCRRVTVSRGTQRVLLALAAGAVVYAVLARGGARGGIPELGFLHLDPPPPILSRGIGTPSPTGRNVLFYTVGGEVTIGEKAIGEHSLVKLSDGDRIEVSSERGCRILFGHASPIGEPVVAHGPFVMNTEAEIAQAVRDYQAGRFGGL